MYETIKNNILNNFLNRNYLWTNVFTKSSMFDDMGNRSPFPFKYNYETDVLVLDLGDNINISFQFVWARNDNNQFHLIKIK